MDTFAALKEIFRTADISPVFRVNPAYASEIGDDLPYISLGDVLEFRYRIRLLPEGSAVTFPYTDGGGAAEGISFA